jgi:hypothetical protein
MQLSQDSLMMRYIQLNSHLLVLKVAYIFSGYEVNSSAPFPIEPQSFLDFRIFTAPSRGLQSGIIEIEYVLAAQATTVNLYARNIDDTSWTNVQSQAGPEYSTVLGCILGQFYLYNYSVGDNLLFFLEAVGANGVTQAMSVQKSYVAFQPFDVEFHVNACISPKVYYAIVSTHGNIDTFKIHENSWYIPHYQDPSQDFVVYPNGTGTIVVPNLNASARFKTPLVPYGSGSVCIRTCYGSDSTGWIYGPTRNLDTTERW